MCFLFISRALFEMVIIQFLNILLLICHLQRRTKGPGDIGLWNSLKTPVVMESDTWEITKTTFSEGRIILTIRSSTTPIFKEQPQGKAIQFSITNI